LEYKKAQLNRTILAADDDGAENASPIILLQPHEQEKLVSMTAENEFAAIRNKCIVELILASALYANEVICLHLAELNLKISYVDVIDSKHDRRVALNMDICEQSCKAWLKLRKKTLSGNDNCSFLFCTKNFEQLSKRRLYEIVSQYLLKAGVVKEHLGADVLRQTAICNMFMMDKTLEEVQQATGIQTLARLEKYRYAAYER